MNRRDPPGTFRRNGVVSMWIDPLPMVRVVSSISRLLRRDPWRDADRILEHFFPTHPDNQGDRPR